MGALAYKDDDEPTSPPQTQPRRFGVIQGGGEGDGVPAGNLSSVNNREDLNGAEQNPNDKDNTSDNLMNYMKDNFSMADKPPKKRSLLSFLGRNKWVVGGGSAVILLGGLFTLAAPLKLQGILSSISGVGMSRIEHYIEKRAQRIILTAIFNEKVGNERNLVKSGSLLQRVAKTAAANKIEERLAAKGIEFFNDGDGIVRVRAINKTSGIVIKTGRFKSAVEIDTFLDGTPVTKSVMRSLIKEDLGVWGFFVRGKVTKWMMSYLGIKRFGAKEVDKTASPEEKQTAQAVESVIDDITMKGESLTKSLEFMENAEALGNPEDQLLNGEQKAAITDTISEAVDAASKEASSVLTSADKAVIAAVSSVNEKLAAKLTESLIKKSGSKLIPGYGEVMLVAAGIVFTHWAISNTDNGQFSRALASVPATAMASIYGLWAGYAAQAKEGTLDSDLFNYFTPFLDGIETSSLYSCVDKNWETGCDKFGEPAYKKLNETAFLDTIKGMLDVYVKANPAVYLYAYDWSPVYLLAKVLYKIDEAIMEKAGDAIIYYISNIDPTVVLGKGIVSLVVQGEMKDNIEKIYSGAAGFAINNLFNLMGLDISSTTGGNKLFDILINGAVYTSNRFAETTLGMKEISTKTASTQTQEYIAEQREYDKSQGALYALFSPEASNSITSQFINESPSGNGVSDTASSAISSLFGILKGTPSSVAGIVTNEASAASYTSPEAILDGVPIGVTDEQLNSPLSANLSDGTSCQTETLADWFDITVPGEFDSCQFDTAVAESLLCSLDSSITETAECNPDASTPQNTSSTGSSPNSPEECASIASNDSAQVWCKAFEFEGFTYKWGGAHGDIKSLVEQVQSNKLNPPSGLADCSGLVAMAIYSATNGKVNQAFSTSTIVSGKFFDEVPLKDAKTGDLIVPYRNSPHGSHVEIFQSFTEKGKSELESNNGAFKGSTASKKFNSFGAHGTNTDGGKISQLSPWYGYSSNEGYPKVYRLKAEFLQ